MSDLCPQCGREFLEKHTDEVSIGDAPEEARDYCNTAEWSEDGFAVYWHSQEQLAQEVSA